MESKRTVYWRKAQTTSGEFTLIATDKGICWLGLPGTDIEKGKSWISRHLKVENFIENNEHAILEKAALGLTEYLKGTRKNFDLSYEVYGSEFQKMVLKEMSRIEYGTTKTYKDLAIAIGRPNASRAIGSACRTNPIAIFIPCHRVIGTNGKLTGYAGGLSTKEWLLQLESSKIS